MSKVIKMDPPQWRVVLQWMAAVIDTHAKVSWNRTNENGVIPAKSVETVLKDMASAADLAAQLQKENEELKKHISALKNNKGTLKEVDQKMFFSSALDNEEQ